MPGRGSYGPGGKWIYSRAARLRKKNPDMDESTSFAIATQQAHKVGKSPKSFRTPEGVVVAKAKMPGPVKEYRKTAALAGFFDEMDKIAAIPGALKFLAGFMISSAIWNKMGNRDKQQMTEAIPFEGGPRPSDAALPAMAAMLPRDEIPGSVRPHVEAFESDMSRVEQVLRKHAAMGLDLRMNGPGNVKRPPFATEGSKGLAMKNFNQSRKVGTIAAVKAPTPAPRAAATML
jgi:hypothetical protein